MGAAVSAILRANATNALATVLLDVVERLDGKGDGLAKRDAGHASYESRSASCEL